MALEVPGYRIVRQVGTGAASKLHMAIELASGKAVAVKHVVRNGADDDRFIEQTETEFAVGNKLSHPNLRRILSIHRVRKLMQTREIMLVMEFVDGLHIEKARPNRLVTFLKLFTKVSEGLNAMHDGGFVHSDIKPTNIMVAQGGIVKIIDFGQACRIHQRKERIQGTPDYIAPEQVRRHPLDQRTDVFNLGATMYWVLTSQKYPTALRGIDERPGVNVVSSSKPIAPVEINDKIPISLSQLVMDCCRDNPADRPADMKHVMARLAVVNKLWQKHRENVRSRLEGEFLPTAESAEVAAEEDE